MHRAAPAAVVPMVVAQSAIAGVVAIFALPTKSAPRAAGLVTLLSYATSRERDGLQDHQLMLQKSGSSSSPPICCWRKKIVVWTRWCILHVLLGRKDSCNIYHNPSTSGHMYSGKASWDHISYVIISHVIQGCEQKIVIPDWLIAITSS